VEMESTTTDREPPLLQIATRPPAGTSVSGQAVEAKAP
jgi:hypothetical protein